jgi:dTDP-4-dehydrorhamnose reductase
MLGTDLCSLMQETGTHYVAADVEEFDVTEASAVMSFVEEHSPSAIINCAAYTAVDQAEANRDLAFRVNRDGAENLANAAQAAGSHFVHVSTDYVFDGRKDGPYTEEDEPCPLGVYGASKLAGEEAVQAVGVRHCIIRTAWLYGIHGKSFPRTILELARAGRPLRVVTDQVGSPTYTVHLATALISAAASALQGTYHAVGSGRCSWHEFAREAVSAAGMHVDIEAVTTAAFPRRAPRPANSVLATEKLHRALGLRLPPWEHGVREFVGRWVAEEGQTGGAPD